MQQPQHIVALVVAAVDVHIRKDAATIVAQYMEPVSGKYYYVPQLDSYLLIMGSPIPHYWITIVDKYSEAIATITGRVNHYRLECATAWRISHPIFRISMRKHHLQKPCGICGGRPGCAIMCCQTVRHRSILRICAACWANPYSIGWVSSDHGPACGGKWGQECTCTQDIRLYHHSFEPRFTDMQGCNGGQCRCSRARG